MMPALAVVHEKCPDWKKLPAWEQPCMGTALILHGKALNTPETWQGHAPFL